MDLDAWHRRSAPCSTQALSVLWTRPVEKRRSEGACPQASGVAVSKRADSLESEFLARMPPAHRGLPTTAGVLHTYHAADGPSATATGLNLLIILQEHCFTCKPRCLLIWNLRTSVVKTGHTPVRLRSPRRFHRRTKTSIGRPTHGPLSDALTGSPRPKSRRFLRDLSTHAARQDPNTPGQKSQVRLPSADHGHPPPPPLCTYAAAVVAAAAASLRARSSPAMTAAWSMRSTGYFLNSREKT